MAVAIFQGVSGKPGRFPGGLPFPNVQYVRTASRGLGFRVRRHCAGRTGRPRLAESRRGFFWLLMLNFSTNEFNMLPPHGCPLKRWYGKAVSRGPAQRPVSVPPHRWISPARRIGWRGRTLATSSRAPAIRNAPSGPVRAPLSKRPDPLSAPTSVSGSERYIAPVPCLAANPLHAISLKEKQ